VSPEATLTVPRYKGGGPLAIYGLTGAPQRDGGWSGRFELKRSGEADALTAWTEAEYYAGRGIPSVTIAGSDARGEYRYEGVALMFLGGDAFRFDASTRERI
jgi:hypothetical protein